MAATMISQILRNIQNGVVPERQDILRLFKTTKTAEIAELASTAYEIKKNSNRIVKLTSTIHITNLCKVTPKCKYCGFAAGTSREGYFHPFLKTDDEILKAARTIEESGIPRVSCSGAHGYGGLHAVRAAKIVKENTSLELLVNVGSDLTPDSIKTLAKYGTDTVCCNLETVNEALFSDVKPGETLLERVKVCKLISSQGIELSSGLLIGIGESYEDRIRHMDLLKTFGSLGEIPIMGFNPYPGTPMEKNPPCPVMEQVKTIAITRILFPDIRITVPTPTIGPENLIFSLLAGADNVATVIPDTYPLAIKGVGSPVFGKLKDVLTVIRNCGLIPQIVQNHPVVRTGFQPLPEGKSHGTG